MLLVALFLCIVMMLGASTLFFTTKTDVQTSVNLAREIRATYLAESIAAQIEARAIRTLWALRFWSVESLEAGSTEPQISFDQDSGHVDLSKDTFPGGFQFRGIVKDLDSALKTYRVYVEIQLDNESFSYAWDKQYQEGVLEGLNRDSSIFDKKLENMSTGTAPTDQFLDEVKETATAPQENTVQYQFRQLLDKLKSDSDAFEAAGTVTANPDGGEPPPKPVPPTDI